MEKLTYPNIKFRMGRSMLERTSLLHSVCQTRQNNPVLSDEGFFVDATNPYGLQMDSVRPFAFHL